MVPGHHRIWLITKVQLLLSGLSLGLKQQVLGIWAASQELGIHRRMALSDRLEVHVLAPSVDLSHHAPKLVYASLAELDGGASGGELAQAFGGRWPSGGLGILWPIDAGEPDGDVLALVVHGEGVASRF